LRRRKEREKGEFRLVYYRFKARKLGFKTKEVWQWT
jgi:hypothetical protein